MLIPTYRRAKLTKFVHGQEGCHRHHQTLLGLVMLRFACLFVSLSAARAQDTKPVLTPCQACCAPGGDCSKSYKGTAGKCCGIVQGQAFCCPGVTFRGPSSGDAKCYNCGTTYRCFTGFSSQNVCGNSNGGGGSWSRSQMRERQSGQSSDSMFFMLLLGFVAVVLVLNCSRSRETHYEGKPVAYGVPAVGHGQPVMGGPVMGGGYGGYGGGYGGGSVAAGAGMGFLGGMVVSDMMHHSGGGHHGGDYGGGDYGGGGGDYGGGGGGFGGGDSGFSADS